MTALLEFREVDVFYGPIQALKKVSLEVNEGETVALIGANGAGKSTLLMSIFGEQQMLAIARALMSRPKLLLLDEPSLGLAPIVVKQIFQTLRELATTGVTIFLVEQNANHALKLSDRGYVMVNGEIRMTGTGAELLGNQEVRNAYLGGH
ncbi:Vitamin B12 import ATP-binding protein BtuD [compost metagenome]